MSDHPQSPGDADADADVAQDLPDNAVTDAPVEPGPPAERVRKRPGDFVMLPPNYILRLSTEGSTDAVLYLTLYGEWSPQFQSNPWGKPSKPSLRGAN